MVIKMSCYNSHIKECVLHATILLSLLYKSEISPNYRNPTVVSDNLFWYFRIACFLLWYQ